MGEDTLLEFKQDRLHDQTSPPDAAHRNICIEDKEARQRKAEEEQRLEAPMGDDGINQVPGSQGQRHGVRNAEHHIQKNFAL